VEVVVGEMGYRVPSVENQGAKLERHCVARDHYCGRRNLCDFSNQVIGV